VASAVDRLRPENVTVVDADSNMPLVHGRSGTGQAFAADEELAKTLVHTLEPVVGADHVRASVHVEYDMGTSEDTQETYDPKTPTALSQEHSEESSVGEAPAGVPGTASNIPAATAPAPATTPPTGAAAASSSAEHTSSKSDSTTYALSKSLHRSVQPAGRVRRIAAAVLVDDAVDLTEQGKKTSTRRKRTVDEMKQIEHLARAAIGVDTQRGDVLAVENLSFQELPLEVPTPPTKSEHWKKLLEPWLWIFRYAGVAALFLVVYFLILRPVKKQAVAAFRELPGKVAQQKSSPPLNAAGGVIPLEPGVQAPGEGRANQLKEDAHRKSEGRTGGGQPAGGVLGEGG
jgi:flagellar M-ring protein FliF